MSGVASAAAQFCALEWGSVLSSASVFASVGWGTGHGPGGRAPPRAPTARSERHRAWRAVAGFRSYCSVPHAPFRFCCAVDRLSGACVCLRHVAERLAVWQARERGELSRDLPWKDEEGAGLAVTAGTDGAAGAVAGARSGLDEAEEQPAVARVVGLWHV